MTHFTNPGTGFSESAQEALTRNIALSLASTILNDLRIKGELTNEDEKATKDRLNTDGLANLEPDMRERVERQYDTCAKVYKRAGIEIPDLAEYSAIRSDIYTTLADVYNQMEAENKEPSFIFYPLNLPLDQYRYLAKNMTADTTIPNNPLKPQDDGDGLWISDWQEKNHDELQKQDEQYLQSLGATIVEKDTLLWGVAVLPAADKPQDLGKSYDDTNGETCTRSQYLTLQLSRIQAGLPPVDKDTQTWFHGKVGDVSPRGRFDRDRGRVRAYGGFSGNRYPYLGCRPPGVG